MRPRHHLRKARNIMNDHHAALVAALYRAHTLGEGPLSASTLAVLASLIAEAQQHVDALTAASQASLEVS